jgi:SAM-dependent methyltransferase
MIKRAREKSERLGFGIEFTCADMTELQGIGSFHVVLCLYDSINYLMSPDIMAKALQSLNDLLREGGIFIFDICTEMNSMKYFLSAKNSGKYKDFSYRRKAVYDPSERIQINEFQIEVSRSNIIWQEVHRQHIYLIDDIIDIVKTRSPFTIEGTYDGFGLRPGTEDSERVHFVLRKP